MDTNTLILLAALGFGGYMLIQSQKRDRQDQAVANALAMQAQADAAARAAESSWSGLANKAFDLIF